MNKTLLVVIIAAAVIAGAYFMMDNGSPETNMSPSPSASVSPSGSVSVSPSVSATSSPKVSVSPTKSPTTNPTASPAASVTIRYTDNGYSPSNVTVAPGTKVTFVNESSASMWVASGPHPQHTLLPEFDALRGYAAGTSYSFTFTKTGEWPFHNHLKASHFGKITVK